MKKSSSQHNALGTQYSARMVTIYADMLNRRSLVGIICLALGIVVLIYILSAVLRML